MTTRQKTQIIDAVANNMLPNIKFSEAQIAKAINLVNILVLE